MDTIRNGTFGLSNTNKLVRFYQGTTGLKTGFTQNAGYCLSATAQRDGLGLIAVVMGAKTSQDRFAACKQLLDYGFANFALVAPELAEIPTIPVKLGTAATVNAIPSQDVRLLINKGQKNSVTTHLELEESVTAPVSKGQKLGVLTVKAGDQVLSQIPMVAESAIPKLTWGQVFVKILGIFCMSREG
jgi:D-alanyl-D-alanine carboxypeptidase (penicillin-binding protein 5/6)